MDTLNWHFFKIWVLNCKSDEKLEIISKFFSKKLKLKKKVNNFNIVTYINVYNERTFITDLSIYHYICYLYYSLNKPRLLIFYRWKWWNSREKLLKISIFNFLLCKWARTDWPWFFYKFSNWSPVSHSSAYWSHPSDVWRCTSRFSIRHTWYNHVVFHSSAGCTSLRQIFAEENPTNSKHEILPYH